MCRKSYAVAYVKHKLKTTGRKDLLTELENYPLNEKEYIFVKDSIDGMSNAELAEKYNISESAVAKKKRKLYERLCQFDMKRIQ